MSLESNKFHTETRAHDWLKVGGHVVVGFSSPSPLRYVAGVVLSREWVHSAISPLVDSRRIVLTHDTVGSFDSSSWCVSLEKYETAH